MKIKILLGLFLLTFFLVGGAVWAQSSNEEIARKHGITFPIAELGNCANYSQCRNFCEDPVNQNTCIDFAKRKGFYKEGEVKGKTEDLAVSAKNELGCDSETSCRAICEQEVNFDKCSAFAKKHGLGGGHTQDPGKGEIIEKAKAILGCDSETSCRAICEQEANRQKCSDFARQAGLRGGEQHVGPGGCTSQESCKAFCSDPNHFEECSKFGGGPSAGPEGQHSRFTGPGGCDSEATCRAYCEKNPQDCRNFGEGGREDEKGRAEEYAKFCREHPDKCGPGQSGSFDNSQKREDFEKFCRDNPEKCGGGTGAAGNTDGSKDQASQCIRYGCTWTNNSCQCSSGESGGGSSDSQRYNPPEEGYSKDPTTGCVQAGCSWNGSSCQCGSPPPSYGTPPSTDLPQTFDVPTN